MSEWAKPLPKHAANIWLSGDTLILAFPNQRAEGRGHTTELRINSATLPTLISILRAREQSSNLDQIGRKECPTQYNLDEIMKSFGGEVKVVGQKRQAGQELTLEDLDI